jgi:hypothetical protein
VGHTLTLYRSHASVGHTLSHFIVHMPLWVTHSLTLPCTFIVHCNSESTSKVIQDFHEPILTHQLPGLCLFSPDSRRASACLTLTPYRSQSLTVTLNRSMTLTLYRSQSLAVTLNRSLNLTLYRSQSLTLTLNRSLNLTLYRSQSLRITGMNVQTWLTRTPMTALSLTRSAVFASSAPTLDAPLHA